MRHFKIKNIFSYVVVAALVAALSISCKSNEAPEPQALGETSSNHPAPGTYINSSGGNATVTINNDGTCTIVGHGTDFYDANDSQTFSIIVTKWWYYYGSPNDLLAGSPYEKSEATITQPATDSFTVSYEDSRVLSISFGPEGKKYYAINLTK